MVLPKKSMTLSEFARDLLQLRVRSGMAQAIGLGVTVPDDFPAAAIEAASAPARVPTFTFPEPLGSLMKGRAGHPPGSRFGLTNFGVNLTCLPPGSIPAPSHSHSHQDEFLYILEGTPVLVTNAGESPLRPGMCAGFKAGSGNAHHLCNRSDTTIAYLEIGRSVALPAPFGPQELFIKRHPVMLSAWAFIGNRNEERNEQRGTQ